jgi:superfamily II DNA or RNA helicase
VQAIVDSVIRIPSAPESLRARLGASLTFPNPEYVRRARFGGWTAGVPREITLLDEAADGSFVLPRGAVGTLRDTAACIGHIIDFEDRRALLAPRSFELRTPLRSYQEEAAGALVRAVQGCAVLPCGAGKSLIGLAAIAKARQPALVLVHTRDLVEQWRDNIRRHLGMEPGVLDEHSDEHGAVVVATVQALAAMPTETLDALGARFGCLVVDEAHHIPASTFREVIGHIRSKYRFGLTATPHRADGLSALLELCLGRVVYALDHERLIAAGHLVVPEVICAETGLSYDAERYTDLISALVADEERNEKLRSLVKWQAGDGRMVLVLSGRVDHCDELATSLRAEGIDAEALTSRVSPAKRSELLDRARARTLPVLCATSIADEGLDLVALDCLVLATPARAQGRTIQRLGRLMRPCEGKPVPRLFDVVDDVPLARRQWNARLSAYRQVLGSSLRVRSIQELIDAMPEVA